MIDSEIGMLTEATPMRGNAGLLLELLEMRNSFFFFHQGSSACQL